jgi:hypothetical protein
MTSWKSGHGAQSILARLGMIRLLYLCLVGMRYKWVLESLDSFSSSKVVLLPLKLSRTSTWLLLILCH